MCLADACILRSYGSVAMLLFTFDWLSIYNVKSYTYAGAGELFFVLSKKRLNLHSIQAFGGLAHLVERKHGMFEVIGSSPISSTKKSLKFHNLRLF